MRFQILLEPVSPLWTFRVELSWNHQLFITVAFSPVDILGTFFCLALALAQLSHTPRGPLVIVQPRWPAICLVSFLLLCPSSSCAFFNVVGRSFAGSSSHHFITPFSAEFAHKQSSLGCIDYYVDQQWFTPFLELDVVCISCEGPPLFLQPCYTEVMSTFPTCALSLSMWTQGISSLHLGSTELPTIPSVDPVAILLFLHP